MGGGQSSAGINNKMASGDVARTIRTGTPKESSQRPQTKSSQIQELNELSDEADQALSELIRVQDQKKSKIQQFKTEYDGIVEREATLSSENQILKEQIRQNDSKAKEVSSELHILNASVKKSEAQIACYKQDLKRFRQKEVEQNGDATEIVNCLVGEATVNDEFKAIVYRLAEGKPAGYDLERYVDAMVANGNHTIYDEATRNCKDAVEKLAKAFHELVHSGILETSLPAGTEVGPTKALQSATQVTPQIENASTAIDQDTIMVIPSSFRDAESPPIQARRSSSTTKECKDPSATTVPKFNMQPASNSPRSSQSHQPAQKATGRKSNPPHTPVGGNSRYNSSPIPSSIAPNSNRGRINALKTSTSFGPYIDNSERGDLVEDGIPARPPSPARPAKKPRMSRANGK